jgi:hypothetical protein
VIVRRALSAGANGCFVASLASFASRFTYSALN